MTTDGDSFLPRIQSVFYAIFDLKHGPKIVYQVPEGLIAVPPSAPSVAQSSAFSPAASTISFADSEAPSSSRASSSSITSPVSQRQNSRNVRSPQKRSTSRNNILFNFDDISKYVIPPSPLCGRLVICTTRRHRIIGFPVELRGKYERNYFRYNLCFVFDRAADLSCYEPVVRKVSRVLTACEEESCFLSSPDTSTGVYAILEQLYEDLNSYSETSISLDKFNSIELKIFPFYPNPPPVQDWAVPVALINLSRRIEPNWDLTMVKVCQYIDGTNHVSRIAYLADCDLDLTRKAISHLLYYQVIMTIDIFQYSNMYTLRKSIQWLADEPHVKEECGPYVTKPGLTVPHWPQLLHLYSRLKAGKTVLEWMQEYGVPELGIDVRRFASFGVIKGFLRRVHRYPVLLPDAESTQGSTILPPSLGRRRGKSLISSSIGAAHEDPSFSKYDSDPSRSRGRAQGASPIVSSTTPGSGVSAHETEAITSFASHPGRRASAAERSLEQFGSGPPTSPRLVRPPRSRRASQAQPLQVHGLSASEVRRHSMVQTSAPTLYPSGSSFASGGLAESASSQVTIPGFASPARPRLSRSPSAPMMQPANAQALPVFYPPELPALLDGEHNTDELATRFEIGWPLLKKWLFVIGGGKNENDFGKVCIIHR